METFKRRKEGITLIALVVTIIVLLILAGVSISVLTGENGLLSRATEAKTTSKIAEIEEQANLEYSALLIDYLSGNTSENVALAAVCGNLQTKYNLPVQLITTDKPTVDRVRFKSTNVTKSNDDGTVGTISIAQGTESTIIEAEAVVTPATGSWYAVVEGKHYKIEIPTGQSKIKIAREESNVDGKNNTPQVTYAVTSLNPSDSGVTVDSSSGAIKVPNSATGTAVITASAGEGANKKSATCTVTVLKYVTVTITAGTGGSLGSGSSTTGSYLEGRSIPLLATPSEGYKFVKWNKTINSETTQIDTNATTNYTVPGSDVTITATFEVKPATIEPTTSCVGYYISIDGDDIPDGIIYADQAKGNTGSGTGLRMSYNIPKVADDQIDGLKEYTLSSTQVNGSMGARYLVKPAENTTGNPRFYIMGLTDIKDSSNNTTLYWYYNAVDQNTWQGKMTDYDSTKNNNTGSPTSIAFGEGVNNTAAMIAKRSLTSSDPYYYGEPVTRDMWGYVTNGWYIPSKEEWAAFAGELGVTSSTRSSFGLSSYYWSSSQSSASSAWYANFDYNNFYNSNVYDGSYVRLGTTF